MPNCLPHTMALGNIYANEHRNRRPQMNTRWSFARIQPIRSRWPPRSRRSWTTAYTEALAPARDYVRRKPDDPSGHILLGMVYRNRAITPRQSRNLRMEPPKRPTILRPGISSDSFWHAGKARRSPAPAEEGRGTETRG